MAGHTGEHQNGHMAGHSGGSTGGRTGRPPVLGRARIVAAAVGLADARGLDAVTMRSVAAALRAAPGSLYRHVSNRADLLAGMQDATIAEVGTGPAPTRGTVPAPRSGETAARAATATAATIPATPTRAATASAAAITVQWRARLTDIVARLVALHRAHPWLADVPVPKNPGPLTARLSADVLAVLEERGQARGRSLAALAVMLNLATGVARRGGEAASELSVQELSGIVVDAVIGVLDGGSSMLGP